LRVEELESRLAPSTNVMTFHNDNSLSGSDLSETQLTPANVNASQFGKLYSYPVDGYVYAQPLYMAGLAIPGKGTHDVVFIATEHDSVYAFDADNPGSGGGQLWKTSFINPGQGVTTIPQPDVISTDIVPEIGITGTPVIDPGTRTLYVVARTKEMGGGAAHYVQRLHALDITSGQEKFGGPATIGDTTNGNSNVTSVYVAGTGLGSIGGRLSFNAFWENQRPALTLSGGIVYIAWASHGDNGPYHGWVVGYRASNLQLAQVFNTSPNDYAAGIWQSGSGLAADSAGNLFLATGNGTFNANQSGHTEYGDTVLRLSTNGSLAVADYFTPYEQATLDRNDADLGSGGTMLLPDAVGSAAHRHLLVETGKEGKIYLIDRDNLGRYQACGTTCDAVVQTLQLGQAGVWGNPAFFQTGPNSGLIYYQGTGDVMKAFTISNGVLSGAPTTRSATSFGFPGAQPVISANGTSNGIAWALQVDGFGSGRPAVLHAYNATNLGQELYNSSQMGARDQLGGAVKFTAPAIADGKVFVGTQNSLSVFGLFQQTGQPPAAPSNLVATALSGTQIGLSWQNNATNASGVKVERSGDGTHYTQIAQVAGSATAFYDSGLTPSTRYYYRVRATNSAGDSAYSNVATATTHIAAPVVSVVNVGSSQVDLAWTGSANDHYDVERSDDGGSSFYVIASVPASINAYSDPGLWQQNFVYRVRAYSTNPNDSSVSAITTVTVGPTVIDHSAGFTNTSDLAANGSAQFAESDARLTDSFGQAGSVFEKTRVDVRSFTTSFHIRLHEGTQPNPADGLTFTLQADDRGPAALGANGGGLGYGPDRYGDPPGILHSVAIKFDVYDNEGETNNSTGIFFNGDYPGRAHNPGEVNVPLDSNVVNLRDQHRKRVDMSYDGSVLTVTITDEQHDGGPTSVTQQYNVNIPAVIGSDTAYVGFTGGTGGLFSIQDVLDWSYASSYPIPGAPSNLRTTYVAGPQIDLAWTTHSYNEGGFQIERSADGVHFSPIGTVGPNVTSFVDANGLAGAAYYRVEAFNAAGFSAPSNVISPAAAFSTHTDVGSVGVAGSTTLAASQYTVKGSGADVWGTADAFQFAAQPLAGAGTIQARVASLQNTADWAKAGLMIREGLGADARNVYLFVTPDAHNGAVLQWRTAPGATTNILQSGLGGVQPPYWLRLVRAGNTFTGYDSADGVSWTLVGTETVTLTGTVYVGLAVTAHNNSVLSTAVFDNVALTQASQSWSRLAASTPASTTAGVPVTLTVTARDAANNRATGYRGTVQFSSSDPQAYLPSSYTFTPGDAGYQTFTVYLYTAGTQTVTVQDVATGVVMGVTVIQVNPAPAVGFWVGAFPSPVASGTLGTVYVVAVDVYGNIASNYTGTVHLTSTDPQAYLDPDYTLTAADAGVAAFSAVLYTTGFQSIIATDVNTGLTGEQDYIEVDSSGGAAGDPGAGKRGVRLDAAVSLAVDLGVPALPLPVVRVTSNAVSQEAPAWRPSPVSQRETMERVPLAIPAMTPRRPEALSHAADAAFADFAGLWLADPEEGL
jgi:hypothetical protein